MPDLIRDHQWEKGARARVLVEATEWSAREQISAVLRADGHQAVACAGPEGTDERCTLAAGHGCTAAEGADVVIHTLRSSDRRNLEAFRALRERLPTMPVVVVVPAVDAARRSAELEGCIVLEAPASSSALLEGVARALGSADAGAG